MNQMPTTSPLSTYKFIDLRDHFLLCHTIFWTDLEEEALSKSCCCIQYMSFLLLYARNTQVGFFSAGYSRALVV